MRARHPIETTQMALRLVPKSLNPVDMIPPPRKALAVVDSEAPQITDIQRIVAPPPIRIHNTVRCHFARDERRQSAPRHIRDDPRIHPPAAPQQSENRDFPAGARAALCARRQNGSYLGQPQRLIIV